MLSRINPVAKLTANLIALGGCVIAFDPYTPALLLLLALAAGWLTGGLRARQWLQLLPFLLFALGMFWTTVAASQDLSLGLSLAFRTLAVGAVSVLLLANTDPTDLMLSLSQQAGLPPRYSYSLLAALRFLPTLESELAIIRAAHRIRGAGGSGGKEAFRRWYRYAIPLLAGGIRRAERVALAMEARGFHGRRDRTYFRTLRWRTGDSLFVAAVAAAVGGVLWLSARLGWLEAFGRWQGF